MPMAGHLNLNATESQITPTKVLQINAVNFRISQFFRERESPVSHFLSTPLKNWKRSS